MFARQFVGRAALAVCAFCSVAAVVHGQTPTKPTDNYDELFQRYLMEAHAAKSAAPDIQAWAWMNALALDHRARNVNDLVTIRVIENITGSGTADSALSKNSSASAAVPKLFGVEKKLPHAADPTALVAAKTATDFKGAGTTTRAGELTAVMTAACPTCCPTATWSSKAFAKSKSTAIDRSSSCPAWCAQ